MIEYWKKKKKEKKLHKQTRGLIFEEYGTWESDVCLSVDMNGLYFSLEEWNNSALACLFNSQGEKKEDFAGS